MPLNKITQRSETSCSPELKLGTLSDRFNLHCMFNGISVSYGLFNAVI